MDKRYVYILKTSDDVYKIGVAKDVESRVRQLQTGSVEEITLVNKFLSEFPFKIESTLHRKYNRNRINGEWYYLTEENRNSFINDCEKMEKNFKCLVEAKNPFI